jgi:hypothetical protein
MKVELETQLFETYHKIFKEKDLPETQTCMCWGVSCGDGWFTLLDKLCAWLQFQTDKNAYPQVVADQVKEKFGTLCFYYHLEDTEASLKNQEGAYPRNTEYLAGAVSFAESLSGTICECCGAPGTVSSNSRWVSCRCSKCRGEK